MEYQFVVTSSDPSSSSQRNRKLVRRRASKAAARTRRQESGFTGINLFQMPQWLEANFDYTSAQHLNPSSMESNLFPHSIPIGLSPSLPRSLLPLRELLELRKYDMSKILLSHKELSPILSDPLRIQKVLCLTDRHFFGGLGERYETNQCINDAVSCLWAYLEHFLSPGLSTYSDSKDIKCYVQALNSVRSALEEGIMGMDIWYATLILILYELLKPSGTGWILHAYGAVHVLKNLGPQSVVTECQKNILTVQCTIMVTESIFKNKSCFLSQPEWQAALRNTITQDPTQHSRSELAVTFWMLGVYLPDVFKDITTLILHNGAIDHQSLLARLSALQASYQNWYSQWQSQLDSAVMNMSISQSQENIRAQVELFCSYLDHVCLIKRFLACLNPSAIQELEEEAANSARRILEIYNLYAAGGHPNYRVQTSVLVARTILATTYQWKLDGSRLSWDPTIDPEIFLEWCKALGRKVSLTNI